MSRTRAITAAVLTLVALVLAAEPAAADPVRPTDYRSTVDRVTPDAPGIDVDIVGGDSFVHLTVEPGHEVVVLGYEDEPYLQVRADGQVFENLRSPARALNEDRYGGDLDDSLADAAAAPEWVGVGDGGDVVWHDHRAHWMIPERAPAGSDGLVSNWTLPLLVDGQPVQVQGRLVLLDPPATIGWWIGAGVLAAVLTVVVRGHRVAGALCSAGLGGLVAAFGLVDQWSLPAGTSGLTASTALGVTMAITGLAGWWGRHQWWGSALGAGAGVAGLMVVWFQRSVLSRALIPGVIPDTWWRLLMVFVAGCSCAMVVSGLSGSRPSVVVTQREPAWT